MVKLFYSPNRIYNNFPIAKKLTSGRRRASPGLPNPLPPKGLREIPPLPLPLPNSLNIKDLDTPLPLPYDFRNSLRYKGLPYPPYVTHWEIRTYVFQPPSPLSLFRLNLNFIYPKIVLAYVPKIPYICIVR
jgi:hypothetical protein